MLLNIWVFYILCLVLKMLSLHCSTCSFCFLTFMINLLRSEILWFFLSLLHSLVFCFRCIINVPQCLLACCVGLGAGSYFVYIKSYKLTDAHFEILTHWFRLSRRMDLCLSKNFIKVVSLSPTLLLTKQPHRPCTLLSKLDLWTCDVVTRLSGQNSLSNHRLKNRLSQHPIFQVILIGF